MSKSLTDQVRMYRATNSIAVVGCWEPVLHACLRR